MILNPYGCGIYIFVLIHRADNDFAEMTLIISSAHLEKTNGDGDGSIPGTPAEGGLGEITDTISEVWPPTRVIGMGLECGLSRDRGVCDLSKCGEAILGAPGFKCAIDCDCVIVGRVRARRTSGNSSKVAVSSPHRRVSWCCTGGTDYFGFG